MTQMRPTSPASSAHAMISCVIAAPRFIKGSAIGYTNIQQAACLIGGDKDSIAARGFTRETHPAEAVAGGGNGLPESKTILC